MTREQTAEVVAVTGASAGVGRATAHSFARRGARVALLARGREGLDDCADEVRRLGGTPFVVEVDVADADAVERAAEAVEAELGPVDVWVNNAMATIFAELGDVEPDEFRRATEVTYLGTVWGTMAALRRLLPRDRGCIVQVGSALSYRSIPLQSAYCGAKFAIRGMTDSLRCELVHRRSRVRVVMVQLPALNTPQFSWCRTRLPRHPQPVPPIYQPEVAGEAVWAASRGRRRERWIGATSVGAIVASKFVPGLLDRYLGRTGYDSQQVASMPVLRDRPDNLFAPVPRKAATHGIFDDRARSGLRNSI